MKIKSNDLKKLGLKVIGSVSLKKTNANKKKHVRESIGLFKFNNGSTLSIKEDKYVLDKTRRYYAFDVVPVGKPRMTQSDKWKTDPNHIDPKKRKRDSVHRYHTFQNDIRNQASKLEFQLQKTLDIVFFIPMPESWNKQKKEKLNGMPCEEKPDTDNLIKAILDTFSKEDKSVWWCKAEKRWAYYGSIIIFQ